ncbi:MAG: lytic transglycosylase domain-containing protein [Bdellovibrionales bacterium]
MPRLLLFATTFVLLGFAVAGSSLPQYLSPDDGVVTNSEEESATDGEIADADGEGEETVVPPEGEVPQFTPLNPKWTPTDFANQVNALGWNEASFKAPKGMEERVQFWKDIYTKYTSNQGLIHDSMYVHLVYEMVDFQDIDVNEAMTKRQKERARQKRVDERKKAIAARLKKLQVISNPADLTGEDLRYWKMFERVDDAKKFSEAAGRRRLRFQLGQRDIFLRGIYQSGRYLRQMEEIFREEGLPIELTRLPFVESSFNLKARSRVGASGIWQFMKSTARMYMRMDSSADQRNDPLRATRAAAKKLKDNYAMLRSWPLAVTAYNHGPSGVKRLTEKLGTTDIVELIDVRKGRFGFASASFFASFLAAIEVEAHADRHFGIIEVMAELRGTELDLDKDLGVTEILKWFNGDEEIARTYNPHIAELVWKGKRKLSKRHFVRVPLATPGQHEKIN